LFLTANNSALAIFYPLLVEKEAMKDDEDNDAADQSMITNEDETEGHYDDSDNDDDGDARLNGSLGL
jgi:hypothetical protein